VFQTSRACVRWSGGRLVYSGGLPRAPFDAWSETTRGRQTIAERASHIRFALGGSWGAARRALWRELRDAARDARIAAEIQREADGYVQRLTDLAFGEGLPRVSVDLHRLVVVPIVLLNTAVYRGLIRRLEPHARFRSMSGGEELRELLLLTVVADMESAVGRAAPTPKRPIPAGRGWVSIGINRSFVWRVPFEAPEWAGHHYLFELTRDPVTRATRKATDEKLRELEASLESLSKPQRAEILRRAAVAA